MVIWRHCYYHHMIITDGKLSSLFCPHHPLDTPGVKLIPSSSPFSFSSHGAKAMTSEALMLQMRSELWTRVEGRKRGYPNTNVCTHTYWSFSINKIPNFTEQIFTLNVRNCAVQVRRVFLVRAQQSRNWSCLIVNTSTRTMYRQASRRKQ